jgi:hypothetical protein
MAATDRPIARVHVSPTKCAAPAPVTGVPANTLHALAFVLLSRWQMIEGAAHNRVERIAREVQSPDFPTLAHRPNPSRLTDFTPVACRDTRLPRPSPWRQRSLRHHNETVPGLSGLND